MQPRHRSRFQLYVVIVLILAIILTWVGAAALMSDDKPDRRVEAGVVCDRYVTESLRAPSTAVLSKPWDNEVVEVRPGIWAVRGWVDAQNGFGAQIRSDFECQVSYVGKDWKLERVNVTPR